MNTKVMLGSLSGAVLLHAVISACTNANAQSTPTVQTNVVSCNQTYTYATGGPPLPDGGAETYTLNYATQAYPGLTAAQIAGHVTNWVTTADIPGQPPGFTLRGQDAIYVQDGLVGAGCGGPTETSTFIYAP